MLRNCKSQRFRGGEIVELRQHKADRYFSKITDGAGQKVLDPGSGVMAWLRLARFEKLEAQDAQQLNRLSCSSCPTRPKICSVVLDVSERAISSSCFN